MTSLVISTILVVSTILVTSMVDGVGGVLAHPDNKSDIITSSGRPMTNPVRLAVCLKPKTESREGSGIMRGTPF